MNPLNNNLPNQAICVPRGSKSQSDLSKRAEGSLFIRSVISSHFNRKKKSKRTRKFATSPKDQFKAEKKKFAQKQKKQSNSWVMKHYRDNWEKYLTKKDLDILSYPELEKILEDPLFKELYKLEHPIKSILSMARCGEKDGFKYLRKCDHFTKVLPSTHHCSKPTCENCFKFRKRKIINTFEPYLNSLHKNSSLNIFLLTISPQNYDDPEEGMIHIKKSFAKFIRNKYIKDRVFGGLYVIESKDISPDGTCKGWNIHIHIIIYGKRLDNRLRGKCLDCGQNLMKYDKNKKKPYCANSKCRSFNVVVQEDSKLVRIWKKVSKRDATVYITGEKYYSSNRYNTADKLLSYLCKYVSGNKDEFSCIESFAKYIRITHKKRLINKFGSFYGISIKAIKKPHICEVCNSQIEFIFKQEIVEAFLEENKPPPDTYPDSWNEPPKIEYIKVNERRDHQNGR